MIGVCRRLSLVLVLAVAMAGPVYAGLGGGAVSPTDPTANSVTNTMVTWSHASQTPDTEPWITEEIGVDRLNSASSWHENTNYYMLQPDPDPTIFDEVDQAVDVVECEYAEVQGGFSITLSQEALGIKAIWSDRWQRKDLWLGGDFTGHDITSDRWDWNDMPSHVFVSYYVAGTSRIRLKNYPLPSAITVYRYPVEAGWRNIIINPEIVQFDKDTGNFRNSGDPWQNLQGIWNNESLAGANMLMGVNRETGLATLRQPVSNGTKYLYVAVSSYAVDYLTYDGDNHLPASYDPDTGEVVLSTPASTQGMDISVTYRPLGTTKVTLGIVPVTDVIGIWDNHDKDTAFLGVKQFDGATGRVTLGVPLPTGTRSVYAEYNAVDIENVTPEDTWEFWEGDRPHPIVRESDDQGQRYCTLQPLPGTTRWMKGIAVAMAGGSEHDPEVVPHGTSQSATLGATIDGRDTLYCWLRNSNDVNEILDDDPALDPPEPVGDVIVTRYNPVAVVRVWYWSNINLEVDITNQCALRAYQGDPGKNYILVEDGAIPSSDEEMWNPPSINVLYLVAAGDGPASTVIVYDAASRGWMPAPMPCTVYPIDLDGYSQPRSDLLRVNRTIISTAMDPDPEQWRARAIPNGVLDGYNVLGVFNNPDLQGWNYWTPGPGKVTFDQSGAAVLQLNSTPADSVGRLYVKVSSYAVDKVTDYTNDGDSEAILDGRPNYYPGRLVGTDNVYAYYDASYPVINVANDEEDDDDEEPPLLYPMRIHTARPLTLSGGNSTVWVKCRFLSNRGLPLARGPIMAVPQLIVHDPWLDPPADVEIQDKLVDEPPVWVASLDQADEEGIYPASTRRLIKVRYHAGMCIGGQNLSACYTTGLQRWSADPAHDFQPMYPDPSAPGVYRSAVSAGLNMASARQRPRYDSFDATDICLLRDPRFNPVDYAPLLVSNGPPTPCSFSYIAATHPPTLGEEPEISTDGPVTTTVHMSSVGYGNFDTPEYNNGIMQPGCDSLTNYPGQNWPVAFGPDPLVSLGPSQIVPLSNSPDPDNGSSSTTFEFRVRYWNIDNLPPKPWLPVWTDEFDPIGGRGNRPPVYETGVVLYLDLMDVFDLGEEHRQDSYRPHFMRPEDPSDTNYADGVDYYYRLQPCAAPWALSGSDFWPPTPLTGNDYISLMVGSYHYFFACSDDSLTFETDTDYLMQFQFINNGNPNNTNAAAQWGLSAPTARHPLRSSTGLDPHVARTVLDENNRPWMARPVGRRASAFGDDVAAPKDWQLYVDRVVRVPGHFELSSLAQYQWPATTHPECTVALSGYSRSNLDGFGQFYGTIQPYYRAVNPMIQTPLMTGGGASGFGWRANRAETCGATTSTMLTFKTKYYQKDSRPPLWLKVFINNASEKYIETTGQMRPENGGYTGYTMKPAAIQTSPGQSQTAPYDYTLGVDYEYSTQLLPGPHTYFFMSDDGNNSVLYPARPEDWTYNGVTYWDWWVPAVANGDLTGLVSLDNNYCPGPYVNNPCELSSPSVTPATGIEGQEYIYRVFYRDADGLPPSTTRLLPNGQRPYQAKVYIDTGTDVGIVEAEMRKEDPTANDFYGGAWYVFKSSSLGDSALAKGVRRYKFEFIDDWGRPADPNDKVKGETTYYPASEGWIEGPTIGTQTAPTLRYGKVESTDGTSNDATLWKFSVEYKDINNDKPKYVTAYVGKLMDDDQTIAWDSGNQMTQADPGDTTYSDGCVFVYQNRLEGPQNPGDPEPSYYYAFEASDGVNLATWVDFYEDGTDDDVNSNSESESAGCLLKDPLVTDDYTIYQASKAPLVGTLENQPTDAGILIDPIVWMHVGGDQTRPVIISREDMYVCMGVNTQGSRLAFRYDSVDAAYSPSITEVLGVYLNPDLTGIDYYHDEDGKPGTYISGTITLKRDVPSGGSRWVWIKYLHTRNDVITVSGSLVSEDDPYVITRSAATPVDPNAAPEIYEILRVYTMNSNTNLFNDLDGNPGSYDFATGRITLGQPVPADSVGNILIDYCMPKYTINRWTGEFTFYKQQRSTDAFYADYFFGTRHLVEIGTNVLPTLSNPKLKPIIGTSSADFIYQIDYKETEGPNGQAPDFVRVVIDGVEHNMNPIVQGTPSYKAGVTYRYTAKLGSGSHNYYFTTSDGIGLVSMPSSDSVTGDITPYLGPWINDPPALGEGSVSPNPSTGTISTTQPVDYVITFSDPDNDTPIIYYPFSNDTSALDAVRNMAVPTPILFVDNENENWNVGIVGELIEDSSQPGKYRIIKVLDKQGIAAHFTADQFAGKLLQIMDGVLTGRVYLIANNTEDELKLMVDDLVEDDLTAGAVFSIGSLQMFKEDPSQQNYAAGVTYKLTVPQLSEGSHKFHFKAASVLNPPSWLGAPYNALTQSSWVRFPAVGDLNGPNVAVESPDGNHEPFLRLGLGEEPVSPASGKAGDDYTFAVTYRDADGDPPRFHDGVLGYIRVIFDDAAYAADMIPDVPEDEANPDFYKTTRRFTVTAHGLPEGNHKFRFEASDGWIDVRCPEAAQGTDPTLDDYEVLINSKATLSQITIVPPAGDANTTFAISVKYADTNGQAPLVEGGRDQVWVEFGGDTANKFYLTRDTSSGANYTTGVIYRGSKTGLTPGIYATIFRARDALGELTSVTGPSIVVSANENEPVLSESKVYNTTSPSDINEDATGGTTHTFRYEVTYTDADGDMPTLMQNGSTVEGVKLYVDGVFSAVVTQKTVQATLPNGSPDYMQPVTYWYVKQGATLSSGEHSYYFEASDGTHVERSAETAGPTILSATIALQRSVYDNGSWVDRDPELGERVRITGVLTGSPTKPIAGGQKVTITTVAPDGTGTTQVVTGALQETATVQLNEFSFEMTTPTINKTWTITAKWNGNSNYPTAVVAEIGVDVNGPTRVVATEDMSQPSLSAPVVDMVCMPLTSVNGDAGSLFGFDRARMMQIVKWDPEQRTYLWYGDTYFPPLTAGSTVWILPSALYPSEAVDTDNLPSPVNPDDPDEAIVTSRQYRLLKPFGRLWDQQTSCEIPLKQGWNQIGSPYLSATEISRATVIYQGSTATLDQAASRGWIRNYAWMWDPATQQSRLIHPTRPDAYKRTIDPWRGYWIRSFVNCTLVLAPPTGRSAESINMMLEGGPTISRDLSDLDQPPAAPIGAGK